MTYETLLLGMTLRAFFKLPCSTKAQVGEGLD